MNASGDVWCEKFPAELSVAITGSWQWTAK
jgi:hypothetical protein